MARKQRGGTNAPDLQDGCWLPVYSRKSGVVAWALVDADSIDELQRHKWSISNNGYVRRIEYRRNKQVTIFLHHVVLGFKPPKSKVVDHVNLDKMDNRRSNLRVTTKSVNRQNTSKVRSDSRSGIKGVYFDARYGKWCAYSKLNGKKVHLGTFDDPVFAGEVVREFRKKNLDIHETAA